MKHPSVFENYARAETLEKILEENGLPVVPALTFDGKKMLESDGRYFYIFTWQEGQITDAEHISKEQCVKSFDVSWRSVFIKQRCWFYFQHITNLFNYLKRRQFFSLLNAVYIVVAFIYCQSKFILCHSLLFKVKF